MKYTRLTTHFIAFFLILTALVVVIYTYGNLSKVFAGTYAGSPSDFSYAGEFVFGTAPSTAAADPQGKFLDTREPHTLSGTQSGDIMWCENLCKVMDGGYQACNMKVKVSYGGGVDITGTAYSDDCFGYSAGYGGSLNSSPTHSITTLDGKRTDYQDIAIYQLVPTLSASPTSINAGDATSLTYSAHNAGTCSIDKGIGSVCSTKAECETGGVKSGLKPTTTTTYTMSCTGGAPDDLASASRSATVTVTGSVAAPVAAISLSPRTIEPGDPTTITWSCTNSVFARITSDNNPNVGPVDYSPGNHTMEVNPSATGTYSLLCQGSSSSDTATASITVTAAASLPDLTANTMVVTPSTISTGETVSFSANVKNEGDATAINFPNVFQVQDSSGVNTWVPANTISSLATGVTRSMTASHAFVDPDTYKVRACANTVAGGSQHISESNYGNNCTSTWSTFYVKSPNLTAGAIAPIVYVAGQTTTTITAPITNNGNASTGGPFTNKFQRATDKNGTGLTNIGFDPMGNLAASGIDTASTPNPFTSSDAGLSNIYVRVCADNYNDVDESDETLADNCGAWTKVTVLDASCSVSPTSASVGDPVTWTAVTVPAVGSYTYSWAGTNNLTGSTKSVTKTYPGVGVKTANVTIDSSGASWNVDCDNEVSIGSASAPDLTIKNKDPLLPVTASTGVAQTYQETITNIGNASTGGSFYYLFQSAPNANPTNAQVSDIGTGMTNNTAASSTKTASLQNYIFASAGTYYVRVCADHYTKAYTSANDNLISNEADETNNCGNWQPITVTDPAQADLIPVKGSLTATSGLRPGDTGTLTAKVKNIGDADTGGGFTNLFEIDNDADHTLLSQVYAKKIDSVPALAQGDIKQTSAQYTFATSGTWYVQMCANENLSGTNVVPESNFGNNCSGWITVTVAPAAAPVCNSFVANPNSILPGGSSRITWSASNATSCTGTGFPTGGATSNNIGVIVSPDTLPAYYGMSCTGPGGTKNCGVVTVSPQCTAAPTISATPERVAPGSSFLLKWQGTAGVSGSCTITGTDGYNGTAAAGVCTAFTAPAQVSRTITTQTTYTINCDGVKKSVTVNVLPKFQEF